MRKIVTAEGQKTTLERDRIICKVCNMNCVEDEIHPMTECFLYRHGRLGFFFFCTLRKTMAILII